MSRDGTTATQQQLTIQSRAVYVSLYSAYRLFCIMKEEKFRCSRIHLRHAMALRTVIPDRKTECITTSNIRRPAQCVTGTGLETLVKSLKQILKRLLFKSRYKWQEYIRGSSPDKKLIIAPVRAVMILSDTIITKSQQLHIFHAILYTSFAFMRIYYRLNAWCRVFNNVTAT